MLTTWFKNAMEPVRKFDEDEDGIEAVQVILILGIAAVVLLLLWSKWEAIRNWFNPKMRDVLKDE